MATPAREEGGCLLDASYRAAMTKQTVGGYEGAQRLSFPKTLLSAAGRAIVSGASPRGSAAVPATYGKASCCRGLSQEPFQGGILAPSVQGLQKCDTPCTLVFFKMLSIRVLRIRTVRGLRYFCRPCTPSKKLSLAGKRETVQISLLADR